MYGAYLRKSRADIELEKDSGIDTLQRHRNIIKETAKYMNIIIDDWYEEIVSGETIEDRPEVQKMLLEVERGKYQAIFAVDVDRLARGDTADQSRISKAFSFSHTKIITPSKTYDPDNDADEEYFEFNLFMSRREYKIINKRLNRGRLSSVQEGKYIGSICPYGYNKEKLVKQKGFKLTINEEEAKIVKIIFDLACQKIGVSHIANYLNKIGSKPRKSEVWVSSSIRDIIHNPVYYGMIKWNHRKIKKQIVNGIIYKSRPKQKEYILVKGLHEPIINKEKWELANKNSKIKEGKSIKKDLSLQNPLAGLVHCSICGRTMQRRNHYSNHFDSMICPLPHCQNYSAYLQLIETRILNSLQIYLEKHEKILLSYQNKLSIKEDNQYHQEIIEKKIKKANQQLAKTFDLLECEIYDNETFIKRKNIIIQQLKELENEKLKYLNQPKQVKITPERTMIPNLKNVLKNYHTLISFKDKNNLLKSLLHNVYYYKPKKGRGHEDEFYLKIFIKL